jgi:hypothetical protein
MVVVAAAAVVIVRGGVLMKVAAASRRAHHRVGARARRRVLTLLGQERRVAHALHALVCGLAVQVRAELVPGRGDQLLLLFMAQLQSLVLFLFENKPKLIIKLNTRFLLFFFFQSRDRTIF